MCTMLDEMRSGNWAGITTQLSNDINNMLRENNINPRLCPQPPQQMSIVEHRLQMPAMPSILSFFADVSITRQFMINVIGLSIASLLVKSKMIILVPLNLCMVILTLSLLTDKTKRSLLSHLLSYQEL